MADIATLGLQIDSSQASLAVRQLDTLTAAGKRTEQAYAGVEKASRAAARGQAEAVAAQQRAQQQMAQAQAQAQQQMRVSAVERAREQARAMAAAMEQQFRMDQARMREDQLRGLLTPEQAREAARLNAEAYNAELLKVLDDGRRAGAFRGEEGTHLYTQIAGSLKNVNVEANRAAGGVGRLRESVTSMAASVLHTAPGVAQFSSILGSMALGSVVMVGVMAAIAAVSLGWRKWTEDARAAKEATKAAREELEQLAQQQRQGLLGSLPTRLEAQRRERDRALRQIEEERAGGFVTRGGDRVFVGPDPRRLAELNRQYREYADLVKRGEAEVNRVVAESNAQSLATLIAANKATAEQRAQARRIIEEDQRKLAELQRSGNTDADTLAHMAQLAARTQSLTDALKGKKVAVDKDAEAARRQREANEDALRVAQQSVDLAKLEGEVQQRLSIDYDAANRRAEANRIANAALREETLRVIETQRTHAHAALAAATALEKEKGATEALARAQADFDQLNDVYRERRDAARKSETERAEREMKESQKRIAESWTRDAERGFAQFFQNVIDGGLTSFERFFDSLGDMLQRMLARVTAEAVVSKWAGPVAAMMGGLLSPKQAQALEAQGTSIPTSPWYSRAGAGLAGFGVGYGIGSSTTNVGLGAAGGALGGAAAGFMIAGPAGAAIGALTGLAGGILSAGKAAREAEREMRALQSALRESLQDAQADAFGSPLDRQAAEIERQRKALEQQTREAYKDDPAGRDFFLGLVEEHARRRRQAAAEEEAERLRQNQRDLDIRRMRADGSVRAADQAAFEEQQRRELWEAQRDNATAAELEAIAITQAAEARRRSAEIAEADERALEDLAVRTLAAQGRAQEADAMRILLSQEREYQDAVKAGLDDAYLAALRLAQAAEAAAAAAARAESEMRAMEDLTARLFAAGGQNDVAERMRLDARHRQERVDASQAGRNAEYMEILAAVQGMERDQLARLQEANAQTRAIQAAAEAEQARLDEQLRVARDQLDVSRDQLREQEQLVRETERVVESLAQFANGLSLGSLSALSPTAKLVEARRQFDQIVAQATAGNLTAAGGVPAAAQALLEASRAVNASAPGFVADFIRVQETVELLRSRFAGQLTIEQQILAALQEQVNAQQQQVAVLEAARQAAERDAQRQIDAINAGAAMTENQIARFLDLVTNGSRTDPSGQGGMGIGFVDAAAVSSAIAGAVAPVVARLADVDQKLGALIAVSSESGRVTRSGLEAIRAEVQDAGASTRRALEGAAL